MDYSQFLKMIPEVSLIAVIVLLLVIDLFSSEKVRKSFHPMACVLMAVYVIANICLLDVSQHLSLFGGMYEVTALTQVVKIILAVGTLLVMLQASAWLLRSDTKFKQGEFYVLLLATLLGMDFMVSAGHFLLFFIGLELASVPMACLIAFDKYKGHSAEAGAKYILSALFSSGLMLYGISFVYGTVGTLYFADIPAHLEGTPLQVLALVFFFSGLGFKISLVPFHLWTADAYQGAPTTVTSYLSVVSKGAAAFILMVVLVKVFAPMATYWQHLLYWVIVASITVANLFALQQQNMKRFLAFSSISQAGYLMLAVISGSSVGMTSLIFYVLVYMAANLAAFGVINTIEQHSGGKIDMDAYDGLYQTNPKLSFVLMLALFSLAGIPPFAGFFSKFFIFLSAFEQGFHLLVFIALINTVISLYYYLKVVKAMYINAAEDLIPAFRSDVYTRISLSACLVGVVLLGIVSAVYEGLALLPF